ncbi:hypothetical protein HJ588_03255 [Flexivirga sp. ID2601S]|uniref:ABM domain-containing protein n=1 Tax=Flexivirga aerilata TaxID=1656889 RepID=A0A849AGA2_9MICO|nr:antibiotic biosynthesis monooxygenase [Flexivirga aerilata]NNG38291.1 hypothetical protein [Flexivirga aerilata]
MSEPTTMINPIQVVGELDRFREIIELISDYMADQEGFAGLRFFGSQHHPDRFYMVAEWTSLEAHQTAADNRPAEVLSWFAELKDLTRVEPDFFATLDAREPRSTA